MSLPEAASLQPEYLPAPVFPQVDLEKGKQRLFKGVRNVFELARSKFKDGLNLIKENRSLALAASGVMLRVVASSISNGDLHTVDMITKTAFSTGLFLDKAVIPLAENLTGIKVDDRPFLSKIRGTLRDLTALSGGMALGGMMESSLQPTSIAYADGPQISPADSKSELGKFLNSDNRVMHTGYIVYPDDHSSVLNHTGMPMLDQNQLPLDSQGYVMPDRNDLSVQDYVAQAVEPGSVPTDNVLIGPVDSLPLVDDQTNITKAGPVIADLPQEVVIDPKWSGLVDNGQEKIQTLLDQLGAQGQIDHSKFISKLYQGINDFQQGALDPSTFEGRLFHFSNGTESLVQLQHDPKFIGELLQQQILTR